MKKTSKKLLTAFGCSDVSDAMRLDMLGMEIDSNPHTLKSLKTTSAFTCAYMNFNLTDEYLLTLIKNKIAT